MLYIHPTRIPPHTGFLFFVTLTVATAYVRPAPFLMGKDMLWRLETAVVDAGRHGMQDLYELEQRLVRAGLTSMSEFRVGGCGCICITMHHEMGL